MTTQTTTTLLTATEATARAIAQGIAAKAFWLEAAGGDMTPMRAEDVDRVCADLTREADVAE